MANAFTQFRSVTNEPFRDQWVTEKLRQHRPVGDTPRLLDVGAGLSRYRCVAESAGYAYLSHDFNAYQPTGAQPGLQNDSWSYPTHDFVCDILDLPEDQTYDAVLCTEVLEHVPDPARAFNKLARLTASGGRVIVTVPILSLMHQAPFWFSSGLSPFWFRHWSERLGLDVTELAIHGDYADLMAQEWARVLRAVPGGPIWSSAVGRSDKWFRRVLPDALLESAGFGTLFVATKK